jgi:hypothetical protein
MAHPKGAATEGPDFYLSRFPDNGRQIEAAIVGEFHAHSAPHSPIASELTGASMK